MAQHPTSQELANYLSGKLSATESDHIDLHVAACQECLAALRQTVPADEELEKLLRAAPLAGDQEAVPGRFDSSILSKLRQVDSDSNPAITAPPPGRSDGLPMAAAKANKSKAITREQFLAAILASRIYSEDEWAALETRWPELATAPDGPGLAQAAVRLRLLTKFQALNLHQGKTRGFVYGDYVVIDRLGQGGMGSVFKARHRRMERLVALKVIAVAKRHDPDVHRRFEREVRLAAKLEHPNIVTAFDAGAERGVPFLVMQLIEGQDLWTSVHESGPLPLPSAIDYVCQAARGLAFAHSKGVIHRDIKSGNLLLSKAGLVKILDMGLARLEESGDALTADEQVMGTIDFMSPEQGVDSKSADARSDIYSLGCTLWHLLTGRRVYEGDSIVARLLKHRSAPLPSIAAVRGDAPAELDQIFHRMVAKRPEDRFQSMSEVLAAFDRLPACVVSSPPQGADAALAETVDHLRWNEATEENLNGELAGANPAIALPMEVEPFPSVAPSLRMDGNSRGPSSSRRKSMPAFGRPTFVVGLCLGALALAVAGVIVIIRDQRQREIARIHVPQDGSVVVLPHDAKRQSPATSPVAGTKTQPPPPAVEEAAEVDPTVEAPPPEPAQLPVPAEEPPAGESQPQTQEAPAAADLPLIFDGVDDHALVARLPWDRSQPLTMEAWAVPAVAPKDGMPHHVFSLGDPEADKLGLELHNDAQHHWSLRVSHGKTRGAILLMSDETPVSWDQPVHLAVTYDQGKCQLFVAGLRMGVSQSALPDFRGTLRIGSDTSPFFNRPQAFAGRIGEIRLSKVVRYSADFEPKRRLEADAETLALYHADERQGDVLKDASGHGLDAVLHGPRWETDRAQRNEPAVPTAQEMQAATARSLGVAVEKPNFLGQKMVLIPAGAFMMGTADEDLPKIVAMSADSSQRDLRFRIDERPQHEVTITHSYRMSATEVTVKQYRTFAKAAGYATELERATMARGEKKRSYLDPGHPVSGDHPAGSLSWNDAVVFCNWLSQREQLSPLYRGEENNWQLLSGDGYRLPTEAEWEYACRGGTSTLFSFGDDRQLLKDHGWCEKKPLRAEVVAQKKPNPFGLFDMHGNLAEWCNDWFAEGGYAAAGALDPVGSKPTAARVVRGGSCMSEPYFCRSASRASMMPAARLANIGFRVVRIVERPAAPRNP